MQRISILITDDHTLVRETWVLVLNSYPRFNVVADCANGQEAIETAKALRPDIVIMDINMPGISGFIATEQIRKYSPGSKILGISQHTQPAYVRKIMQAGALGYVTKNSSKEEMCTAIEEVYKGNKYICKDIRHILADRFLNKKSQATGLHSLSSRELEIIGYVKKGYSTKEIAAELYVAVKTVEVHRHNILKKLNLKNAASLVNFINCEYPE